MTTLARRDQLELAAEAARAPSVHNVQPARWRFLEAGEVRLYRALDRALPCADPSGRDVRASLGAAFEGLALALSKRGLLLGAPQLAPREDGTTPAGHELVATARWSAGAARDPLAEWVERRRSQRALFDPPSSAQLQTLVAHCAAAPDLRLATGRDVIEALSRAYDRASYGFLAEPSYQREFFGWCRFQRSHPGWERDGLNADCLALGALERVAAGVLLRPPVFAALKQLGLARPLVSEARAIRSSSGLVLFSPLAKDDLFDVGRRFYRLWLELTALGFHLCPLSALADDREAAEPLERAHDIGPDRRLVNVLRVGVARTRVPPRSARIPAEELLV